jgi:tetratricopeptide (TPR) repeat protein
MNPVQRISKLVGTVAEWLGLKVSYVDRIDGVIICDLTPAQPSKDAFLLLTRQAMALIKSLDARRYRRVCRYLHYIANTALLSRGQYGRALKICRVDYDKNFNSKQAQTNVREYAGTLIHEATHGLLYDKGIPYEKETRERVERLCHLETYRFALRFEPGYADLFHGPYNPEWHRRSWESSMQFRRVALWKRFQEMWKSSFPKNARDYQQIGRARTRKGEYDKAIADCDKAIRLDPQFAEAYFSRGTAYLQKRENDSAIVDFDHTIQLDPKDARAFLNRGTAYFRKRDYDKAISDADRAIQLNPQNAVAYINRGTAYLQKRDYEKAIADYNGAIQLNPKSDTALTNVAWLLATCPEVGFRDGRKAVQYATKACLLSEWKNPSAVKTLAAACAEAGDFENAVKWETQYLGMPSPIAKATLNAESRLSLYQAHKPYRQV